MTGARSIRGSRRSHRSRRARRIASSAACSLLVGVTLVPSTVRAWPTQPNELVNELRPVEACEFCHNYQNADEHDADPRYAPSYGWRGTLMANSARDPVFWAGVAVADADAPGQTELCVRCHAPRAFLDGNGDVTSFDGLTLEQTHGVECELCHRMMDDGVTPPGNAAYTIDDVIVGTEVPRRGPWDYTDGVSPPPHSWIADPYVGSSRLCGTCHDVTTPAERVDEAGVGLGVPFNEQRTYSEWARSAFAIPGADFQSCQDCHMPAVADMPGCGPNVNLQSHPTGGRRHDLVGANRFMVELLKQEYGSAGANLIGDIYFDDALARIDAFLPTSATLSVDAPASVDLTQAIDGIDVTVVNETGHKLPTGYSEGRVMWIEVLGDYAGTRVFSSGAWSAADGIEADPQIRRYEAIAEQWSTGTEFHLLLNDHWLVDNRIPPRGLAADLDTDPVGDRYTLLPDDTWPNYDAVRYAFSSRPDILDATPADPDDDVLELTVRVRYLINTPEYIDFLATAGGMAGADVAALFDLAGGSTPLTLAEQTVAIPITGFGDDPSTTAGESGETSGTGDTGGTSTDGGDDSSTWQTSAADDGGTEDGPLPPPDGCACAAGSDPSPLSMLSLFGIAAIAGRRTRRRGPSC